MPHDWEQQKDPLSKSNGLQTQEGGDNDGRQILVSPLSRLEDLLQSFSPFSEVLIFVIKFKFCKNL